MLQQDFDPDIAGSSNIFINTYEIPSVMVMSIAGADQANMEKLSYGVYEENHGTTSRYLEMCHLFANKE